MITNLVLVSHSLPHQLAKGLFVPLITTVWLHEQYLMNLSSTQMSMYGFYHCFMDAHEGLKT